MSVKGRIYMSVKERISKRVFQENKARQIFRKTNISYPPKKCSFFMENLVCFVFLKYLFWDLPDVYLY